MYMASVHNRIVINLKLLPAPGAPTYLLHINCQEIWSLIIYTTKVLENLKYLVHETRLP